MEVMLHAVPLGRRYADAAGVEICASQPKEFRGHLCRCGAKWLKWLSHLWVIQRRKKWVIGRSHPSVSASSLLDDLLPLHSTRLTSSPHCFCVCFCTFHLLSYGFPLFMYFHPVFFLLAIFLSLSNSDLFLNTCSDFCCLLSKCFTFTLNLSFGIVILFGTFSLYCDS